MVASSIQLRIKSGWFSNSKEVRPIYHFSIEILTICHPGVALPPVLGWEQPFCAKEPAWTDQLQDAEEEPWGLGMHSCSSADGHVRLIAPPVGSGRFTCLRCWPTSFQQARVKSQIFTCKAGDSDPENIWLWTWQNWSMRTLFHYGFNCWLCF